MNETVAVNTTVLAAGIAALGASAFTILAMKKRISNLESTVRVKNGVIEDAWRNFHLATEKLGPQDMLSLLHDMKTNSEFNRITLDI